MSHARPEARTAGMWGPDTTEGDVAPQGTGRSEVAGPDAARPGVTGALAVVFDLFGAKAAELADAVRRKRPRDETGPLFWEVDRTTVWMTRLTSFVSARVGHSFAPTRGAAPAAPAAIVLDMFGEKAAELADAIRLKRPREETTPLFLEVDRMTVWMGRLTSFVAARVSSGRSRRDASAAGDVPTADGVQRREDRSGGDGFRWPDCRAVADAVLSAPASSAPRRSTREMTDELLKVLVGIPARPPRTTALPRTRLDRPELAAGQIPQPQIPPEQARPDQARPEDRGEAAQVECPGPVGTARAVEPVEPVNPVRPAQPVEPVRPAEPSNPLEGIEGIKGTEGTEAIGAPGARATPQPPVAGDGRAPGPLAGRGRGRDPAAGGEGPAGARYASGIDSGAGVAGRAADPPRRPRADGRAEADGLRPGPGDRARAAADDASDAGGARGGSVMTTGPPG